MFDDDANPPAPAEVAPQKQRQVYHRELDELTAGVMRLGALTCETIPRTTDALLTGNLQAVQDIINDDDEIDSLTVALEDKAVSVIALQAPMAGDLRRLMTITKLVAEIERSADLMVNVCKAGRRMYGSELSPKIRGLIAGMSTEANKLMRLSLDAFADENVSLAEALQDIDNELDQLNRDMVGAIFAAHADDQIDLAAAVQLALIARYYERVGDHAVNIGERVAYMVTGWLPEYNAKLRTEYRHRLESETDGEPPENEE